MVLGGVVLDLKLGDWKEFLRQATIFAAIAGPVANKLARVAVDHDREELLRRACAWRIATKRLAWM
jgi:hypothetical protein